jgi:hypothetical protein
MARPGQVAEGVSVKPTSHGVLHHPLHVIQMGGFSAISL